MKNEYSQKHYRSDSHARKSPSQDCRHDLVLPCHAGQASLVDRPFAALLAENRTDRSVDLRLHHGLGAHPDALTQDISISLCKKPANERTQIH